MASAIVGLPMISYQRSTGTWLVSMIDLVSWRSSTISRRLGAEGLGPPVVEDEQIDAGELAQDLGVAAIGAREGEGCEEARDALIGDREIFPAGLMPERAGEPALADAARAGDQQIMFGTDPVAAGELEEKGAIEAARGAVIDVLDGGRLAQLGGAGAALELLLAAQGRLLIEQQGQPFGVIETACLGLRHEIAEALGHAVKAERQQLVEGGVGEHGSSPSVEVAGTAQVRMG